MASRVLVSNYQLGVTKLWMQTVQKKHVSRMTQLNMWLKYFFFFFFAKYALQLVTYFLYKVTAGFIWHFDLFMFKSLKNFFNMKELILQNIEERPQFIARYYRHRRPYSTIFRAKSLIADSYSLSHLKSVEAIPKIDSVIFKLTEKKLRKKKIALTFRRKYKRIKAKIIKLNRTRKLLSFIKKIKKKLKYKLKKKIIYKWGKDKRVVKWFFNKKFTKIKKKILKKKSINDLMLRLKILQRRKNRLRLNKNHIRFYKNTPVKKREKKNKLLLIWFLKTLQKNKKNYFLKFIYKRKLKILKDEKSAILKKRKIIAKRAYLRAKKFKKQLKRLRRLVVVNKFIRTKKNKKLNFLFNQYLRSINLQNKIKVSGEQIKKKLGTLVNWKKYLKILIWKSLSKNFLTLSRFKKRQIAQVKLLSLYKKLAYWGDLKYNPRINFYLNKKFNIKKKSIKKLSKKMQWQFILYKSLIYFQQLIKNKQFNILKKKFTKLKRLKKQFFLPRKLIKKKLNNKIQKKKIIIFVKKFLNKFNTSGRVKNLKKKKSKFFSYNILKQKKKYNKLKTIYLRVRRGQRINYLRIARIDKIKRIKLNQILTKKNKFFNFFFKQSFRIDNPVREYLWRYRLKTEKNFIKSFILQRRRKWLAHKNFKLFMTLELASIFRSLLEINYFYYNQKIGKLTLLTQIKRMWEWGRRNINYSKNEFYHILRLLYLFRLSFRFNDFFYFLHYFAYFFETKKRKKDQIILGLYRVILKKLKLPGVKLQGLHFTMAGKFNRKPRARTITIKKGPVIPFQKMDLKVQYCARIVMTNFGLYYMRLWLYYHNF